MIVRPLTRRLPVRVCINAARPVYRLFNAENDLQAVYPDAPHSFPPAAREAAYEFLDARLKPTRQPRGDQN